MLTSNLLRLLLTRSAKPFTFEACPPDWQPDATGLDRFGLYVHIPFCRTLCSFCPYCRELYTAEKAAAYLPALLQEIDRTGQAVSRQLVSTGTKTGGQRHPVTSLYFGGGTPALMLGDLPVIIGRLQQYFEITDGIGIELHPQDITPQNLQQLKSTGITMVSLGLQSFDHHTLARIGRSEDRFAERLGWVREAGFSVIDVDLIFAIPGQTPDSLRRDITLVLPGAGARPDLGLDVCPTGNRQIFLRDARCLPGIWSLGHQPAATKFFDQHVFTGWLSRAAGKRPVANSPQAHLQPQAAGRLFPVLECLRAPDRSQAF